MLFLGADRVYRSTLLGEHSAWLEHGFATRFADGWPGEYTRVQQTHSDIVHVADGAQPGATLGQGDAMVTHTPGVLAGIRTADCVPVLLVDPEHRAVAAVHAGWRGTVQNIVGKTIARMADHYGTDPRVLRAAIGPAIGECCYEVGGDVADRFNDLFPEAVALRRINLAEANRRQLAAAGVRDSAIDVGGLCTQCHGEFHSYRRDKEASGRMVAAIGVRR